MIFQFSESNITVPDAILLKISQRQNLLTHQIHMASKVLLFGTVLYVLLETKIRAAFPNRVWSVWSLIIKTKEERSTEDNFPEECSP